MYVFIGCIAAVVMLIIAGVVYGALKSGDKETAGIGCIMLFAIGCISAFCVYRVLVVDIHTDQTPTEQDLITPSIVSTHQGTAYPSDTAVDPEPIVAP